MTKALRVLIVDDNRSAADALVRVLKRSGDEVEAVYDGETAIHRIEATRPDLVLTDLKMEPIDGLQVLAAARAMRPPVEVIVFTAYGGVDVAVKAMRLGARDFLTKPVTVDQVLQRLEALRDGGAAAGPVRDPFVAESPAGRDLLAQLQRAAQLPSPVWLEGEIGAGRGFCAHALHQLTAASDAPLIVHDPLRDRPWPTRGTVLLANVDDLPDDAQRTLRRSLDQLPAGVRVVTTASAEARRHLQDGRMRPELFYTLAVVQISVPPLRARTEDILPLLEQAIRGIAARYQRPAPPIPDEAKPRLLRHAWPGNIRELYNLAERAVVIGAEAFVFGPIERRSDGVPAIEEGFDLSKHLEEVEHQILIEALRKAGGDRTRAGRILGVERNTLRYKLAKYGLLDR